MGRHQLGLSGLHYLECLLDLRHQLGLFGLQHLSGRLNRQLLWGLLFHLNPLDLLGPQYQLRQQHRLHQQHLSDPLRP